MALATTARQLGAVLGVALLVAVIGTPAPGEALSRSTPASRSARLRFCSRVAALGLGERPAAAPAAVPAAA